MKNFFLLLAGSLIIYSCNKDQKGSGYLISGKIVDPYSGEVVTDVQVSLSEQTIQNGAYNTNFYPIDTVFSDANGQYQIEFSKNNALAYKMKLEKEGFYTEIIDFDSDDLTTAETNIMDQDMYTKSMVLFHILNSGDSDASDNLTLYKKSGKTGCENCCPNEPTEYDGANVNIEYFCAANGGAFMAYEYTTSTAFGFNYIKDSVFCPVNDTVEVLLEY